MDEPGVAPRTGRREEIFAAAAEVFWEKGYHGTSMRDLAAATDMRKASLYHHVSSKEALLFELSVASLEYIIGVAESAVASDPEQRLRDLIERHVTTLIEDRNRHATMLVELRSLPPDRRQFVTDLRSRYDRIFDEAIAEVQKATRRWPDTPTVMVRLAVLGMLNWAIFWFSADGSDPVEALSGTFADIILGD